MSDAVEHDAEVGPCNPKDMTDVRGGELLYFPQEERQREPEGRGVKARVDGGLDFLVVDVCIEGR